MDLNYEYIRFKTFDNYPVCFLNRWTLAFLGFYFIGPVDDVKCKFCNVIINSWEFGDDIFNEHKRWSPNCPLLLRQQTRNIPRNPLLFEKFMDRVSPSVAPPAALPHPPPNIPLSRDIPPSQPDYDDVKYPKYTSEYQRNASFEKWSNNYDPIVLAEAGFFYVGTGDRVQCFNCGIGLRDWDIVNDDPWEQHALHSTKCSFVLRQKGIEFIKRVILASKERKNITTHLVNVSCSICHIRNYNTIFLPCRHVSTCLECTRNLQACPICNESFERYLTLYLC